MNVAISTQEKEFHKIVCVCVSANAYRVSYWLSTFREIIFGLSVGFANAEMPYEFQLSRMFINMAGWLTDEMGKNWLKNSHRKYGAMFKNELLIYN